MRKQAKHKEGKVFDKNLFEVISKDKDHMCTRYIGHLALGQKNATHPNTCLYDTGCSDCSDWASSEGYQYWCCYDTYCCAYAASGPCSDNVNCPSNDC